MHHFFSVLPDKKSLLTHLDSSPPKDATGQMRPQKKSELLFFKRMHDCIHQYYMLHSFSEESRPPNPSGSQNVGTRIELEGNDTMHTLKRSLITNADPIR